MRRLALLGFRIYAKRVFAKIKGASPAKLTVAGLANEQRHHAHTYRGSFKFN